MKMKYIDTDGTEKEISYEVEKKFKEQNKNWFLFECIGMAVSVYTIYWCTVEVIKLQLGV
jgi:uncharacterized protein YbcV (DUF1398 family)